MVHLRTIPATPALVPLLLDRMGPARTAALDARCGGDAAAAIVANIAASPVTWCGIGPAGVVSLGGVMPVQELPGAGYVWQFIADVAAAKRAYIEQGLTMRAAADRYFARLIVVIETNNRAALRHSRRLGFRIGPVIDFGGAACHFCERIRDV